MDDIARYWGTEKDKVNCPFYHRIGACRHGDGCSRVHNRPAFSETLLFKNLYPNPSLVNGYLLDPNGPRPQLDPRFLQDHFETFFEEIFLFCAQFGPVADLIVCENLTGHLFGNVYVRFADVDAAEACLRRVKQTRATFAGRAVDAEFSPVTNFADASCKEHHGSGRCSRGHLCSFLHALPCASDMWEYLQQQQQQQHRGDASDVLAARGENRKRDRTEQTP